MRYLSELFLDTLNYDYSISSISNAIEICTKEIHNRQEPVSNSEYLDYYDVIKEFSNEVSIPHIIFNKKLLL